MLKSTFQWWWQKVYTTFSGNRSCLGKIFLPQEGWGQEKPTSVWKRVRNYYFCMALTHASLLQAVGNFSTGLLMGCSLPNDGKKVKERSQIPQTFKRWTSSHAGGNSNCLLQVFLLLNFHQLYLQFALHKVTVFLSFPKQLSGRCLSGCTASEASLSPGYRHQV